MTKVHIAIELLPAHKGEDGRQWPASIEAVRANIPATYFEVKIVESVLEVDAAGQMVGYSADFRDHNADLKYPYEIYSPHTYEGTGDELSLKRDEFLVMFQETATSGVRHLLVLNAGSMEDALVRLRQTYPDAVVVRAEQNYGDAAETSREFLDNEILVVHSKSDGQLPSPTPGRSKPRLRH